VGAWIVATVNSAPVSIFQAFNITVSIKIPTDYSNMLSVNVIPSLPGRVKICSAIVYASGENLPCPKCLNEQKTISYYKSNESESNVYDSMLWSVNNIHNKNLRSELDDNPNVNLME
jgi:hypothetical protein